MADITCNSGGVVVFVPWFACAYAGCDARTVVDVALGALGYLAGAPLVTRVTDALGAIIPNATKPKYIVMCNVMSL